MTDTLEKAIDWMDLALRETREALAQVDPDKREEAARDAVNYLFDRALQAGASTFILAPGHGRTFGWCQIEVCFRARGLTIFDMWLAAARAKAGAE